MTRTRQPFPLTLDLDALHAAYQAAPGITEIATDRDRTIDRRRYQVAGTDGSTTTVPLPTPAPDGTAEIILAADRDHVAAALGVLVEHTGNPHYQCGPRNARERAMLESLNLLMHSADQGRCACGNRFDGDNLCLLSACAHEV